MTTAKAKPIQQLVVEPAIDRDVSTERPTEIRYGWCPYGNINLFGPSGTPNYYVQPHMIDTGNGAIDNPYHRELPKGQLIPFPTFAAIKNVLSPDRVDSNGRAVLEQGTVTITALQAASTILGAYAGWGFIILNSLQGLEQRQAMRIFSVVHPFEYLLGELENELAFGAPERIDSTKPLVFGDYVVQPLRDDVERDIARHLAEEMEAGARTAASLANEKLDETESSMTQKFAGGNGKSGADPLDRRLAKEMGRELPKLIGNKKDNDIAELKDQMQFLVGREASRADKEEIERLRAKVSELENGSPEPAEKQPLPTCGGTKSDGTICMRITKGGRCPSHPEQEEVTV